MSLSLSEQIHEPQTQRAKGTFTKADTCNHIEDLSMVQGIFLI